MLRQTSMNDDEGITPYDIDALPPASPPTQKAEAGSPPAWKANQGIDGRITDEPPLKSLPGVRGRFPRFLHPELKRICRRRENPCYWLSGLD